VGGNLEADPAALAGAAGSGADRAETRLSHAVGNPALLNEPLLGLLASRDCPGRILLDTLELVPEWVRQGRVILSGFHSPLEQQVLRSVLRRQGRIVKVLARAMGDYHPPEQEREPLRNGNLLVISAYSERLDRTTRETALARNRLILALASELITPHVSPSGGLATLLAQGGLERSAKAQPFASPSLTSQIIILLRSSAYSGKNRSVALPP
jgi:predicted Rossmann fold nucleotide-binding protein DprA/Smf involved in DNA uptake